ncbi:complement C1q-like protein 2 [Centroberyx affinis]|uniref:complement C1q-like protein 2 n=1 Tax=Centroberyx affinis TaxID=166261 RepID=UPI003A5C43C6
MGTTVFGLLLLGYCLCGGQAGKPTCVISPHSQQYIQLVNLNVKMIYLQKENEAQAKRLRELEKQKSQVDILKRQLQVKQVAFSASLLASGHGYTGPYKAHTNLVFRRVATNIGNAYNPHTGVFTAPVRGVYHFQFYVSAYGHASIASSAMLVKNKEQIFMAYEHRKSGYGTAANGVSLLLEVGDVVFLRLWHNTRIYDDSTRTSSFSGHLLFTM